MKLTNRELGARLARRFKLPNTALIIANTNNCYQTIFAEAVKEAGSVNKVAKIALASKSGEFIAKALIHLNDPSKTNRNALVRALAKTSDPGWHYNVLSMKNDLSDRNVNALARALAKSGGLEQAMRLHSRFAIFASLNKTLQAKIYKMSNQYYDQRDH